MSPCRYGWRDRERASVNPFPVRPGQPEDLPELLRIYNHYVVHTHITFDTRPLSLAERSPWLDQFADTGPHRLLVAEAPTGLAGYACSTRLRPKPAYDTSVETTIYVDPVLVGKGIGGALYGELLDILEEEPRVHRAFGGIALPNEASIVLHERHGFRHIGTFGQVGHKFGRFWDVAWYERNLSGQGAGA
jgi:phosphinothricin acetyltransferase